MTTQPLSPLTMLLSRHTRRREFIALLGGAAAWPLVTRAEQSAIPVIGFLNTDSPGASADYVAGFRKGLGQTGYFEGKDVAIEFRWAEGRYERMPELAAELVRRRVDVIFAAYLPAALAAKSATSAIPIVFLSGLDPIDAGLVASLNRPGGNLTGLSILSTTLVAKRIELLQQVAPNATAIGLLVNPTTPATQAYDAQAKAAAETLGLRLTILEAGTESEIDAAFASLARERAGALVVSGDSFFNIRFDQIAAQAARYRIPTIYDRRESVVRGGLMSYGPNFVDLYRQSGIYTGKVLKGARPADLPVEQSTKIELIVNLSTARSLGIDVPMSILLRADELIE